MAKREFKVVIRDGQLAGDLVLMQSADSENVWFGYENELVETGLLLRPQDVKKLREALANLCHS